MSFIKNFKSSKVRALFPIISVAASVISVVIISSVSAVGRGIIGDEIKTMGLGGLMISSKTEMPLSENVLNEIRTSKVITGASPMSYSLSFTENKNETQECVLWGVDGCAGEIMHLNILCGREINNGDVRSYSNVCVIDSTYAKERFGRENAVGKKINVMLSGGYQQFEIVGIADGKSSIIKNAISNYVPCFIYIPYTAMQCGTGDVFLSSVAVNIKDGISASAAEKDLYSRIGSEDLYQIENMMTYSDTILKILDIITVVLSAIAGISLVIAGISVMTVMLFSVGERTREIGIKKSIGAGFLDILFEFLSEAVAISALGGIIGVGIGVGASALGCNILGLDVILDYKMILVCLAVTTAFGIVFGIYPAIRAARLSPCDALRRS